MEPMMSAPFHAPRAALGVCGWGAQCLTFEGTPQAHVSAVRKGVP